jgi:hypothetical protein
MCITAFMVRLETPKCNADLNFSFSPFRLTDMNPPVFIQSCGGVLVPDKGLLCRHSISIIQNPLSLTRHAAAYGDA